LFVVADGMGGMAAGEQASREVVRVLQEVLTLERIRQMEEGGGEALLREALQQANDTLLAVAQQHPEWRGMGSTAVVALLQGDTLHVANLGDSRAYLVRRGQLRMLSRDHSVIAELVERGMVLEEEAGSLNLRNQLTASLGGEEWVAPAYTAVTVQPGDRIVLCSDGLWDLVPDREIARLTWGHPDPQEAVQSLIDAANLAGGLDNITVIVIAVESPRIPPTSPCQEGERGG